MPWRYTATLSPSFVLNSRFWCRAGAQTSAGCWFRSSWLQHFRWELCSCKGFGAGKSAEVLSRRTIHQTTRVSWRGSTSDQKGATAACWQAGQSSRQACEYPAHAPTIAPLVPCHVGHGLLIPVMWKCFCVGHWQQSQVLLCAGYGRTRVEPQPQQKVSRSC